MSIVHDDHISLQVKARTPRFTGSSFECIARKTLPSIGSADLGKDLVSRCHQSFGFARNIALLNGNLQSSQARFLGCVKNHRLIVNALQRSRSIHNLPKEFQVLVYSAPGTIPRERAKIAACADAEDAGCGRDRSAEQRAGKLEELPLLLFMTLGFRRSRKGIFDPIRR